MTDAEKITLLREAAQNMLDLEARRMYEHDEDLTEPEPCPCPGCACLRAAMSATAEKP